jgi:hypothetical protein
LYDTLKSYQKEKEYQRIQGRLLFFSGLTTAAASLIGGFLGMYDLRLPIFLTAGAVLASLGIFLFIPEERPENGLSTENYSTHVVETIHLIRKNPMIVLLFSFFIIFSILAIIEGVFRQIYLETELGIEVFVIGAIYAVMIILTSFGARFSYRLTDVLGPKLLLWVHVIIIGISFALLSLAIPWLSIPAILVFGLFLSTYLPFSSQIINDEIPSEKRATVFSMLGIGVTTTGLVFEVLAGYLAKSTSISFTYSILTILFLLLCVIPLIFWTKTSFQEKATLD